MVKLLATSLLVLPLVAAYPGVPETALKTKKFYKAHKLPNGMWGNPNYIMPPYRAPTYMIKAPNSGLPQKIFNAEKQYVSTKGKHRFIPPRKGDRRGQCAGLNAAANHGYLPRDGMPSIAETIEGLAAAYEMGQDVTVFLGVLGVALEGDPFTERWSIGGGMKTGLGSKSGGLYGTHNKYENDASMMMGDAYLNGGEVSLFQEHSFKQWNKFRKMFNTGGLFTFRQSAAQSDWVNRFGIMNNPYFFKGPFSGIVSPAAHNLVIELMSNYSAEHPEGILTSEVFNSFFAVTGEEGNYKYTEGWERIPDNWYRRPFITQNNLAEIGRDLVQNNDAYPGIISIGGNTGTTNSFVGVSMSNYTGGQFNSVADLAKGNNFACFVLQASLQAIPDDANPALGKLGSLLGFAISKFEPLRKAAGCAQLKMFDNSVFNQFPGAKYHPKGGN